MRRAELSKVHDASGVVAGGGGQLQLADEIVRVYVGAILSHSAQYKGEVPRKRGRRDWTAGLGEECAVACDPGVNLVENGLRRRDHVQNEVKRSHPRILARCDAPSKSVGIELISDGDRAALRGKEWYTCIDFLIDK